MNAYFTFLVLALILIKMAAARDFIPVHSNADSCIEKVDAEENKDIYYCCACDRNFLLSCKSKIDAHLATTRPQKNAADLAIGVKKSREGYSHKFSSAWTIDERFKN